LLQHAEDGLYALCDASWNNAKAAKWMHYKAILLLRNRKHQVCIVQELATIFSASDNKMKPAVDSTSTRHEGLVPLHCSADR
jgi:hypothetical protein